MPHSPSIPRFVPGRTAAIPDAYVVNRGEPAPVLFAIHGISRNAAEMATRFAEHPRFADWTIVAPLFEKARFGQYQQLLAGSGQTRSDLGLLGLLDELRDQFKIDCDQLALFGFSGGAQFAHRFAMLYPARVRAVVAVSAGWYLMPDPDLAWPYGFGDGVPLPIDRPAALDVPITVVVGDNDLRIDGSVRQTPLINMMQGETRLRRAKRWAKAMHKAADETGRKSGVELRLLANGVHDFGACARGTNMMDIAAQALDVSANNELPVSA
jgi:pimeloyl-ACP methyl ester carboxylesterase